jgi:hypothetical protein
MATLEQHEADCVKMLGKPFRDVHLWLDEYSRTQGGLHRKFRHHREGIEEARILFGNDGAAAAIVHILRDCRNIPSQKDYPNGTVDPLGLKKEWPIAAYAKYTEEAFSALVKNTLEGPLGIVFWAFFDNQAELNAFLGSATHLTEEQRAEHLVRWPDVVQRLKQLPPLETGEPPLRPPDGESLKHFEWYSQQPAYQSITKRVQKSEYGFINLDALVNPLVILDYEYVEELRATLDGDDEIAFTRFALPKQVTGTIKTFSDQRTVTLVSPQKTFGVVGLHIGEVPDRGIEVRFLVSVSTQAIIVSEIGGRIFLRSGIHRAFLLASMGVREIPCILVHELQIPLLGGAYPTFSPAILARPRPPLLRDALDRDLSLQVPIQRTHKVVRISAEDIVIPVD